MKASKYLYIATGVTLLVLTVFLVTQKIAYHFESGPESSYMLLSSYLVTALFTFPTGIIGVGIGALLTFTGYATIAQSLFLAILISFATGFWQWFVLFPKLFKRR